MDINDIHFKTVDHKGRLIHCTNERWFNHILDEHDYMENQEDAVIEAIKNPDPGFCYHDVDRENRRVYYKTSHTKDYYTKVVVEFNDYSCSGNGRVISTFQPDSIKTGEKPEWNPKD